MKFFKLFENPRLMHMAATLVLVPLWTWFGYRHVNQWLASGEWSYLFFCISETLTVGFLLIRTYPKTVSNNRFDWLVAIIGTFSTLLLAPSDWGIFPFARYAVAAGTILQILGLISLNRSFALVAAKREIKTGGMYRFIRHPLYASYLLIFTSYVLANTSVANVVVYVFAMACMFVRISREERHLALDAAYGAYMKRVRYRILPFVF